MSSSIGTLRDSLIRSGVDIQTLTPAALQGTTVPQELQGLGLDRVVALLKETDTRLREAHATIDVGPQAAGQSGGALRQGSLLGLRVGQAHEAAVAQATAAAPAVAEPVATGQRALEAFDALFQKALTEGNWDQDGVTIRLSGKETASLEGELSKLLDALPNHGERAFCANRVAGMLAAFQGVGQEKLTASKFAARVDALFQAKLAPGGFKIDAFKEAPIPTDINLSGIKTAALANELLQAVLGCHMRDEKAWTIDTRRDGQDYAAFEGQKVRVVKAETHRIMSLIEELFAVLPASEHAGFKDLAEKTFDLPGSEYELQKTFPKLKRFVGEALGRVG